MMKDKKIAFNSWEESIRRLYDGQGVRCINQNSYETCIKVRGEYLYCGTYPTEEEAKESVVSTKIKLFKECIIANGDSPFEVVECVDKGYFASKNGNIYNRYGHLMIGAIDRCGYRHIILNKKNRNVHRVIAETFISNPDNLPCVNHKDGNKLNNSIDNLEWSTHSENTVHAYQMGLEHKIYGEKHHAHKLREDDVRYIRQVYIKRDKNFGATALSNYFNVDRTTIQDVVNKKTWREVF